jgi:hypothetical protein
MVSGYRTNFSSNLVSLVQHNHDHDEQDNGEEEYLQQDEFDSEEVVDLGEGEPMEESDDDDMEGKSFFFEPAEKVNLTTFFYYRRKPLGRLRCPSIRNR